MTLSEELQWRGFANQTTYKDISVLDGDPITFYLGVDPSADSMTIGNLAAAMMARRFVQHGHSAILLVGGATGLIGDPDGKSAERDLKSIEQIAANKEGIAKQYSQVFGDMKFEMVDNYDWFKNMNYLTFLRDIGKHAPMRQMLSREFVQTRLSEDGAGISYAEFSYSLIQGYDFLHLYREHGVSLQLCGADQWGNSIAGVDLIRRVAGGTGHVWSTPLIINKSTGKKFGKTEEGAVWLDENRTSVFKFYQFWINADDEGVEDYMKVYTDLDKDTLGKVIAEHKKDPSRRVAQKRLAYEVTCIVHGVDRADAVVRLSAVLFAGSGFDSLSEHDFVLLAAELDTIEASSGSELAQILVDTGLASSKGEARRFMQSGAVSINGKKLTEGKTTIGNEDGLQGHVVLKRGKNTTALVKLG